MPEPTISRDRQLAKSEHPIFIGWIALISQLPLQLFFTVWAGGFFGGFTRALVGFTGQGTFIVFGLLAFFGVPCVAYFGKRLNYAKTTYKFYRDHLEFEEGFFSRNRKVIAYCDIREVSLKKGILQRTCGLGTVYLGTLATGSTTQSNPFYALGFGNVSASGIAVKDIRNPDAAFESIQDLVETSKSSRAALPNP